MEGGNGVQTGLFLWNTPISYCSLKFVLIMKAETKFIYFIKFLHFTFDKFILLYCTELKENILF